jgi:SpoVK/Ycf46/Vps4 family AAA+-type ATPase
MLKDIVGQDRVRSSIKRLFRARKIAAMVGQTLKAPSMLLYGPSGTGKTYMAEAVANEYGSSYIYVCASDIKNKYVGESEKALKKVFVDAKRKSPCIIVFDEIHALFGNKGDETGATQSLKSVFLTQMNDRKCNIVIMAATNLPWELDTTILRRFNNPFYLPLPDHTTRIAPIRNLTRKTGMAMALTKKDLDHYSSIMDGFSPSDIENVVEKAQIRGLLQLDEATHFMKVKCGNLSFYLPCNKSVKRSEPMTLQTCPGKATSAITPSNMLHGIQNAKKSTFSEEEL